LKVLTAELEHNDQQVQSILSKAAPTADQVAVPSSGEVVGPDGAKYSLEDSRHIGDAGWKDMLAPAG